MTEQIPTVDLNEYTLIDPNDLASRKGTKEVVIVAKSGAMVSGTVHGLFADSISIGGVHNIPMLFSQIERLWVKRPSCPHDTLRRQYEGKRATIIFICATDSHPECHRTFTVQTVVNDGSDGR